MEKKKSKGIWITIIIVVVIAIVVAVVFSGRGKELGFNTATVSENTVEVTVMATGYVQPVEKVEVGTQVSGVIEELYVDFNSVVTKGQLLAELDKSTLQEKLNQANASLTSARSDQTYARQNFERTEHLFKNNAATQVAYEEAINRLEQANTSVVNAEANVHQAKVNLSYATITSPINGVILDRSVNVGQTVAASFNTPTLFTIAEDLTKMQVEADVDEADIGKIKVGQKVTFNVDAHNIDTFEGIVQQIRLQPTVTNNVVTYTVIIEAPNPDNKLLPGMTANINIIAQSETGITVPVEAINFKMTPEMISQLGIRSTSAANQTPPKSDPQQEMKEVWVLNGDTPEQRSIVVDINDGVNVIVKSGVSAGDKVILSVITEKKAQGQAAANPLMPQRRR